MEVKEIKRPIGFCAWDESDVKTKDETAEFSSFEDKFGEYDKMMLNLIDENTKLRNQFLKEKRRRIAAELDLIDYVDQIKKLKKKLKKLKKAAKD